MRWHHHGVLPRTVLLLAPDTIPAGVALRIVVPDNAAVEASVIGTLAESRAGGSRLDLDLGPDGADAENALIDAWRALGQQTTERVWCAVGPLAGVLLRISGRAIHLEAVFGSICDLHGAPNGRSRSLLAALVPDSWTLGLSADPPVDADRWRTRLRLAIESGWTIRWDEQPTTGGAEPAGWLDAELTAAHPTGPIRAPIPAGDSNLLLPSADTKVLQGRHGRLFLAQDTHESHRQLVGERPLAAEELEAWERGTRSRQARMLFRSARLIQLIGPAPQAVHEADLPDGVSLSPDRPAMQVLRRLHSLRPQPELLYPIDELRGASARRDPFAKTDSHWNDLGAYLAYEAVLRQLGDAVPVRRVARDGVSFQDTCFVGDLGEKVAPARASIYLRARVHDRQARIVRDNIVRNHGREAEFACDAAPPSRCVVFGDSWAYMMTLFLAESFRRLVFRHRVNVVDDELVEAERPDLVLTILTERFCTALPLDEAAIPFAREVARKHRVNALVAPQVPGEPHSFMFSLELDRGLPDRPGFQLPEEP